MASAVLLLSMASGRRVNTISRFVCMDCEPTGGPGASFTEHLYGTLHAAAIHVGTSPDCRKLGLGVREISIVAGTDADVMASGSCAAGRPLARLS